MGTIVVGVDESPSAKAALRWAVHEGEARGWTVKAVLAWTYLQQHHVASDTKFEPDYGPDQAADALSRIVADTLGDEAAGVEQEAVCDLPVPGLLARPILHRHRFQHHGKPERQDAGAGRFWPSRVEKRDLRHQPAMVPDPGLSHDQDGVDRQSAPRCVPAGPAPGGRRGRERRGRPREWLAQVMSYANYHADR